MKSVTKLTWALIAVALGSGMACNCGKGSTGAKCTATSDCQTDYSCVAGVCEHNLPDGGAPPPPSDGGCVGLQCQQVTCPGGGTTTVTGSVYDPSGLVPLYNAIVYVPNGTVEPFPSGVACNTCGAGISGNPLVITLTGPDGKFTLQNVPAGSNIPLVYQIGKWRRQVTLPAVTACTDNALTDVNVQRLPRSQAEGDIPQMAIATGDIDPMECLMLKMGIALSEFTLPSSTGRVHMYQNNGLQLSGGSPPGTQLYMDSGTLANYDVVLFPCEGGQHIKPDAGLENIVNYTNAGGRLFATHYSYVWTALGWPPFPSTANWTPDNGNTNAPPDNPANPMSIDTSFPKGQAFHDWLNNVGALDINGMLDITAMRADVASVVPGTTRWIYGNNPKTGGTNVEHLTFNTPWNPPPLPDGGPGQQCGRVVFSDFHVVSSGVSSGTFPGSCPQSTMCTTASCFTPQEKALMFMLFDVSACVQSDNQTPSVCPGAGMSCSTTQACCSGLACVDNTFSPCQAGQSCTCQVNIN